MDPKCNQDGCGNPGAFRFTWPGRDEGAVCSKHAPKLRAIVGAMGMHLQMIPLVDATGLDWDGARTHLANVVSQYVEIGAPGRLALMLTLNPLVERLESGERTQELYDEIMGCE